jgi:hypothetical protein
LIFCNPRLCVFGNAAKRNTVTQKSLPKLVPGQLFNLPKRHPVMVSINNIILFAAAVRYSLAVNLQLQANVLPMQHLPYSR